MSKAEDEEDYKVGARSFADVRSLVASSMMTAEDALQLRTSLMKYSAQDKVIELQKRTAGADASNQDPYSKREASGTPASHGADAITNTVFNLNNGEQMILATEQRAIARKQQQTIAELARRTDLRER